MEGSASGDSAEANQGPQVPAPAYVEADFASGHTGEPLDRERLVDDFIFLTFLVGNDFLPHLPTLDIGEHAFDVIFGLY